MGLQLLRCSCARCGENTNSCGVLYHSLQYIVAMLCGRKPGLPLCQTKVEYASFVASDQVILSLHLSMHGHLACLMFDPFSKAPYSWGC